MCSYEDKAVLGNPLTKWEGVFIVWREKEPLGVLLSHTGSGRPTLVGSPGVREGSYVRQGSVVLGL